MINLLIPGFFDERHDKLAHILRTIVLEAQHFLSNHKKMLGIYMIFSRIMNIKTFSHVNKVIQQVWLFAYDELRDLPK